MREVDRVIRPPLNESEWDMIRTFVRRMERSDLRLRFGRSINFDDDETLKRTFDIQAGRGDLSWTLGCYVDRARCAPIGSVLLSPARRLRPAFPPALPFSGRIRKPPR